ncbi:hypothetical protein AtEden1_Chr5g0144491 [Arabidopsis thaliana]
MAKEEAASLRQQLVIGPSCSKSLCFIYWLWKSRGFCLVMLPFFSNIITFIFLVSDLIGFGSFFLRKSWI